MIQSMTGFAEKQFNFESFVLRISIKTLNHRFLDWHCRGNHIGDIENRLRDICRDWIQRGRVDVYLDFEFLDPGKWDLIINEKLLKKILDALQKSVEDTRSSWEFRVDNVLNIPHIFELKRKDFTPEETRFIEESFLSTVKALAEVRKNEGSRLRQDIINHLEKVKDAVKQTAGLAAEQPGRIHEIFSERIKSLTREMQMPDEKILEEAAFSAQKYDLSEEIERLNAHVSHAEELLNQESGPVGRQLDFLSQEILREANTINSKAQGLQIVKQCLSIKTELESIRQQVQNLE
jgi:uncharacterized protein (TIGR00255 family)